MDNIEIKEKFLVLAIKDLGLYVEERRSHGSHNRTKEQRLNASAALTFLISSEGKKFCDDVKREKGIDYNQKIRDLIFTNARSIYPVRRFIQDQVQSPQIAA